MEKCKLVFKLSYLAKYLLQFLTEWKSKTRKKARIAKRDQTMTGGGPSDGENLSDIENRLMKGIGWITITSCDDLPPEINPDSDQHTMTLHNGPHEVAMEIVNENDISFNEEYLIELEAQTVGEIQGNRVISYFFCPMNTLERKQ